MNFFREEITIGISMIFAILIMIFLHIAIEIEEKNKAKKKTFSKGKRVISVVFTVIISLVIISIIGGLGIHTIYKNSKKVGSSNQTTSSEIEGVLGVSSGLTGRLQRRIISVYTQGGIINEL